MKKIIRVDKVSFSVCEDNTFSEMYDLNEVIEDRSYVDSDDFKRYLDEVYGYVDEDLLNEFRNNSDVELKQKIGEIYLIGLKRHITSTMFSFEDISYFEVEENVDLVKMIGETDHILFIECVFDPCLDKHLKCGWRNSVVTERYVDDFFRDFGKVGFSYQRPLTIVDGGQRPNIV